MAVQTGLLRASHTIQSVFGANLSSLGGGLEDKLGPKMIELCGECVKVRSGRPPGLDETQIHEN